VTVRSAAQDTDEVQQKIREMAFGIFDQRRLREARKAFLILDVLLGLTGSVRCGRRAGIVNTMVMSIWNGLAKSES